jgi:hypothetical protein
LHDVLVENLIIENLHSCAMNTSLNDLSYVLW